MGRGVGRGARVRRRGPGCHSTPRWPGQGACSGGGGGGMPVRRGPATPPATQVNTLQSENSALSHKVTRMEQEAQALQHENQRLRNENEQLQAAAQAPGAASEPAPPRRVAAPPPAPGAAAPAAPAPSASPPIHDEAWQQKERLYLVSPLPLLKYLMSWGARFGRFAGVPGARWGHFHLLCVSKSLPHSTNIPTFGQKFYGGSAVKCSSMCRSKHSEDDKCHYGKEKVCTSELLGGFS